MSRPLSILERAIADAGADDPRPADQRIAQAAEIVRDFSAETCLSALDAVLAAEADLGDLEDLPPLADELADQTELLQAELSRLRALAPST